MELELVAWLRSQQVVDRSTALGIGDDMAVLPCTDGWLAIGCDMVLDGVHFRTDEHTPEQVGRKALACCLSDCAAMAVQPMCATVALALPAAWTLDQTKALFRGMFDLAVQHPISIVGGDTTRWNNPLAIDVSILAKAYSGVDPVTRSAAKGGDDLFVTGPLGGSLLGRHMAIEPRIQESKSLAEGLGTQLHAMMDISDGLALDLWRMCEASNVGAILDERCLASVTHDDAKVMAERDGRSALEHVLGDGEDFELLLAVAPDVDVSGLPLFRIGQIEPGESSVRLQRADGGMESIEPTGWQH